MTELAARETAFSGSDDSAAAMVAISGPTIEKITVDDADGDRHRRPAAGTRRGAVRLEKSIDLPGHSPSTKHAPIAMKATIAATLMPANQNSNSP